MYLYPRIITTLSYFHNYHTMKLIRQLDVSLNVILYPEAQNYENHFKVGGSQTPGLSSKSQVNKTTCRCSTGHSQIWWHLPALHPQVTWSQCSGVPGSSSQWRGDAVGCKADPASSWSSFIEDKSWAYSSTGSFCINWGNLSEGVLPSRCMQTNWGCWFFSQGCSETGCREMYGCCPGPTESVLQQQPHRPLIQRLLQFWPSRCFCLFGLQQLLYEACPAATVFVDFLFHSPAQLSMLCYKLPVLV